MQSCPNAKVAPRSLPSQSSEVSRRNGPLALAGLNVVAAAVIVWRAAGHEPAACAGGLARLVLGLG